MKTQDKYERLCAQIREKEQLVVAFSGGVDSTLVAFLATQELGRKALAVTIDSELFPKREREQAKKTAKTLGIRHIIKKGILLDEALCQNTPQRCYHCKKKMADLLWEIARGEHIAVIADGVTQDDLHNTCYLGVNAWTEAGIWHPLADCGFTKNDIHTLAQGMGLETWDKPSESCLATRLGTHERITPEKLRMIEEAEDYLIRDFPQVRVRMHNGLARIELPMGEIKNAVVQCGKITKKLKRLGFRYVTLDLEGYKSGSMNIPP